MRRSIEKNTGISASSARSYKEYCSATEIAEVTIPRVGQGVRIDARDDVFVVLRTDLDRGTADVLRVSGVRQIEGGIPLGMMRILSDDGSMAAFQVTQD